MVHLYYIVYYLLFRFLIVVYIIFYTFIGLDYSSESDSAFEGGENLNATNYTNNKSSDSGLLREHCIILTVQILIIEYIRMLPYTLLLGGYYDI